MNKPAEAKTPKKPRPTIPTTFTASEACVIRRSIFGVLRCDSRHVFRKTGWQQRTSAETNDLSARTTSTLAKGEERTRDVYWGMMTWTLTPSALIRMRIIMVKVGLSVRDMATRERDGEGIGIIFR